VTALLLSVHVIAAILAVGPVTVAASMFPPQARLALGGDPPADALARLRVLARICRSYALVGVAVPVLGLATAGVMGVSTQPWVLVSVLLTLVAAAVLAGVVLPAQRSLLRAAVSAPRPPAGGNRATIGRLAATTGVFNLLWVVVTVLMIVRPGSTTGV
jgi:hypothetical protein